MPSAKGAYLGKLGKQLVGDIGRGRRLAAHELLLQDLGHELVDAVCGTGAGGCATSCGLHAVQDSLGSDPSMSCFKDHADQLRGFRSSTSIF
jgi:hypothetical protein